MGFDVLSTDMQEKARAAETMEELVELANESGRELSDEELDSLSGGNYAPTFSDCTSFVTCRTATDTRGSRCTAYRFL
jgi:hypothetical protein